MLSEKATLLKTPGKHSRLQTFVSIRASVKTEAYF